MQSSLLILGAGPIAERLIEEIEALDALHSTVLGVVDNQPPDLRSPLADRWLGTCDPMTRSGAKSIAVGCFENMTRSLSGRSVACVAGSPG